MPLQQNCKDSATVENLRHLINLAGCIPAITHAGYFMYSRFKTPKPGTKMALKQYTPIGGTITAGKIIKITKIATLDDNSQVEIPDGNVDDYVIQNPSGSVIVDAKTDFESKYTPA
jgi:hypothetical protein